MVSLGVVGASTPVPTSNCTRSDTPVPSVRLGRCRMSEPRDGSEPHILAAGSDQPAGGDSGQPLQAWLPGDGPSGSIGGLGVVEVQTEPELLSLVEYVLGDRCQPVIALASMGQAHMAVLPPRGVRAIIGSAPPIYVIRCAYLLGRLADALGGALALTAGAARIWWPGLSTASDPLDHPLVVQMESERADSLLEEFALQFDLSRPRVRVAIKALDDVRALIEQQLQRTNLQLVQSRQQLRDVQVERHRARTRAESAEAQLDALLPERGAEDLERSLHAAIFREWMTLTEDDRREYPLGRYVLTQQLLKDLERQPDLPRERLAWVCTMLASRYTSGLAGIAQRHLVKMPGGEQVKRSTDGAIAGRCSLNSSTHGEGPYLDYWERPDGTIEFAAISSNDETKIREP